jgi:hypothetical protein
MEWAPSQGLGFSSTEDAAAASKVQRLVVYRGPYEYGVRSNGLDFIMQYDPGTKPE